MFTLRRLQVTRDVMQQDGLPSVCRCEQRYFDAVNLLVAAPLPQEACHAALLVLDNGPAARRCWYALAVASGDKDSLGFETEEIVDDG